MAPTIEALLATEEEHYRAAKARKAAALNRSRDIVEGAQRSNRQHLTADEDAEFTALREEIEAATAELRSLKAKVEQIREIKTDEDRLTATASQVDPNYRDPRPAGTASFTVTERPGQAPGASQSREASPIIWRDSDGRDAALERSQRFNDHPAVREVMERNRSRDELIMGSYGSLGEQARALTTGGASAVVPTAYAGNVIDLARNESAVLRAGATIVPMPEKTLQLGRLSADPASEFIGTEGTAFNASDPSFDYVQLVAKTQDAIVVGSMEWFQDAVNAGSVVENALAQSMALYLDKIALYGGQNGTIYGTNGLGDLSAAKFPKGLLKDVATNAASHLLTNGAANGTPLTAATPWNEFLDGIYAIILDNETPTAAIMSPTLRKYYAKTYDANYQPLRMPDDVAALKMFVTNQVPTYNMGTGHNQSDLFIGDFSQMLIGIRSDLTLRTLTERYAEAGQIAIVATMRWDCVLARPKAFSVTTRLGGY